MFLIEKDSITTLQSQTSSSNQTDLNDDLQESTFSSIICCSSWNILCFYYRPFDDACGWFEVEDIYLLVQQERGPSRGNPITIQWVTVWILTTNRFKRFNFEVFSYKEIMDGWLMIVMSTKIMLKCIFRSVVN